MKCKERLKQMGLEIKKKQQQKQQEKEKNKL